MVTLEYCSKMDDDLFNFDCDLQDTPFDDPQVRGLLDESRVDLFSSKFDLLDDLGVFGNKITEEVEY